MAFFAKDKFIFGFGCARFFDICVHVAIRKRFADIVLHFIVHLIRNILIGHGCDAEAFVEEVLQVAIDFPIGHKCDEVVLSKREKIIP